MKGTLPRSLAGSALVVWDMQYGVASHVLNYRDVVGNIRNLIDAAHSSGIPVIYSQHTGLPYEYLSKYAVASMLRRGLNPKAGSYMAEGTHDWKIVKELTPASGDLVLKKQTASFFVGTPLEQILRNRGVDTLIFTGVATEMGVEGSARHASYLGFIPIIVEDAVAGRTKEFHEHALAWMRLMFTVKNTATMVRDMRRTGRSRSGR